LTAEMALSQLFLLSRRGDRVVSRDYRGDAPAGTADTFAAAVGAWGGAEWDDAEEAGEARQAPHVFHKDGVTFFYAFAGGMYLVGTAVRDGPPLLALELLQRVQVLVRDFLGVFNETSVRKNFALVCEILDETADFGYPQATRSDEIARSIQSEPAGYRPKLHEQPFALPSSASSRELSSRAPAGAAQRPAVTAADASSKRSGGLSSSNFAPNNSSHVTQLGNQPAPGADEIFVDVVEQISATFACGTLRSASINGGVHLRSFLSGMPRVRLALGGEAIGNATLAFDERCDSSNFHADGTFAMTARRGESRALVYRTTSPSKIPITVQTECERASEYRLEVTMRLQCRYSGDVSASSMVVLLPLPRGIASASARLSPLANGQQSANFDSTERCVRWNLGKVEGGSEHLCHAAISLSSPSAGCAQDELGPLSLHFSLPKFSGSGLQVRFLHLQDNASREQSPARWVRYVLESDSYTVRL